MANSGWIALAAFLLVFAVGGNLLLGPTSPASAHPHEGTTTPDHATHSLTVHVVGAGEGRVTSSIGGIDCTKDASTGCTYTYTVSGADDRGLEVTLTAYPEIGSTFEGFSGNCPRQTTPCTVTGVGRVDFNVTATFSPPAPTKHTLSLIHISEPTRPY